MASKTRPTRSRRGPTPKRPAWQPLQRAVVQFTEAQRAHMAELGEPTDIEVWQNDRYQAIVRRNIDVCQFCGAHLEMMHPNTLGEALVWQDDQGEFECPEVEFVGHEPGTSIDGSGTFVRHLSIRRLDRKAARDWRDFQRIKNQLAGPEVEAVELYPAASRVVDTANEFHLWCAPPGVQFPVGWTQGIVASKDEALDMLPAGVADKAQQRPPEDIDRPPVVAPHREGAVTMPETPEPCPRCKGTGVTGGQTQQANDLPWTCDLCGGVGLWPHPHRDKAEPGQLDGFDTLGSASRQHWIDTGTYLRCTDVWHGKLRSKRGGPCPTCDEGGGGDPQPVDEPVGDPEFEASIAAMDEAGVLQHVTDILFDQSPSEVDRRCLECIRAARDGVWAQYTEVGDDGWPLNTDPQLIDPEEVTDVVGEPS